MPSFSAISFVESGLFSLRIVMMRASVSPRRALVVETSGLGDTIAGVIDRYAPDHDQVKVEFSGSTTIDSGLLEDDKGNLVAVLTVPVDRGKPLPGAHGVRLRFPQSPAGTTRQAWGFLPARVEDGTSSSQPLPLTLRTVGNNSVVDVGIVDSAVVVLLAKDGLPLLGITAPRELKVSSGFKVGVQCANPSPRPLHGRLRLVEPGTTRQLTPARDISVPAWESVTLTFNDQASSFPARLAVGAALTIDSVQFMAVPVDCYVK